MTGFRQVSVLAAGNQVELLEELLFLAEAPAAWVKRATLGATLHPLLPRPQQRVLPTKAGIAAPPKKNKNYFPPN